MSVLYGHREVGYGTPAPGATHRQHESPVVGDSQSAIMRASGGCMDGNFQLIWFTSIEKYLPVLGHWTLLRMNGYTHTTIDGHLRKLTAREKRMSTQAWVTKHGGTVHALNALRKRGGGRKGKAINDFPMTWKQAIRFADKCNTIITPELKSRLFRLKSVAADMAAECKAINYPLWPMALLKMRGCKEKCEAFVSQGLEFCMIFGKFRSQARGTNKVRGWKYKPTQIWGPKSAKQWLRS